MSKKNYLMGNEVTEDQMKESGKAVGQQFETTKEFLEKQAEKSASKEFNVQEVIKNFPWRPHQDRVVILPDPAEQKLPSGIIIPDTVEDKPQSGVIIALGEEMAYNVRQMEHLVAIRKALDPSYKDESDAPYLTESQLGDRVLYGKYAGFPVEIGGIKYLIIRFADIVMTLK